jgi:hypothetical protein
MTSRTDIDTRCVAYTKKNERCKNQAKFGNVCGRHQHVDIHQSHSESASTSTLTLAPTSASNPIIEQTDEIILELIQEKTCASETCASETCASETCASETCASETCASETCASDLKQKLLNIINDIMVNPTDFIQSQPPQDLINKLDSKTKKNRGQGRANGNTTQEASFAYLLEQNGITSIDKSVKTNMDGLYYIYQPNGTQRVPDFTVFECHETVKTWSIDIDMKQSSTNKIVLNDGWFNVNTIYILSYKSNVLIGLGQHIPSEREKAKYEEVVKIKRQLNSVSKRVENFEVYFRTANQYNCAHFTQEDRDRHLQLIEKYLS